MGSRFTLAPPADFVLRRDVCSYGYFLLAPNHWSPADETLTRPLSLSGGVAVVTIAQPEGGAGSPLRVKADRALDRQERDEAGRLIGRMLQFGDEGVAEFHRVDPRWKKSGRGRLFRSPTFFEDVVKTVTSCNVTWPSTVSMNRRLCEVVCPAFPSPGQLARRRPATLRARCGVGYRDVRIVELAKLFRSGEVDPAWFEDPARGDDEVFEALLELPGVGPYAAGNILQLLGRYSRLAIDTESVRHGRTALGMEGSSAQVERQLAAHYERFGRHQFRSFWFELWTWYEGLRGPASTWERERVGSSFTASTLQREAAEAAARRRPPARRAR